MIELPINETPYIRTFTQYAFIDTIINNKRTTGDILAEVELSENVNAKWFINKGCSNIIIDSNNIIVEESNISEKLIKYIYRNLELKDQLIVKVNYQQYTNPWDSIGIFLNDNKDSFDDYSNIPLAFLNYNCDYMSVFNNSKQTLIYSNCGKDVPIYLKIAVQNQNVELYHSYDMSNWVKQGVYKNFIDIKKNYIVGVFFHYLIDNTINGYLIILYN